MNKKITELILLFFLCIIISSCASMNIKPIGTQQEFSKEDDEKRIWKRCEEEQGIWAKSGLIYENNKLNEYLNGLVNRLLPPNVKSTNFIVKVLVMKDPDINACMYPNGVMYINTGMLANIENEAQLVIILGHELTHAVNRHSLKRFRNFINMSALFSTLYVTSTALSAYSTSRVDYSSLYMYGLLSSVNGYSREMEKEADIGSFDILLKNNYDVKEAPKVFELFERDSKEQKEKLRIPYVYMDHPSNKARIKSLNNLCKQNEKEVGARGGVSGEDSYNDNIRALLLENATLDIKKNRFISAKRVIERFLKFEPENAKGYYYLGEVFCHRNEKDDKEKAIDNYKKAIDLDKNFPSAHRDLGMIYYKNKQYDEATKEFETYLALAPNEEDFNYINKYLDQLKNRRKE